jgi:hypothetical protein
MAARRLLIIMLILLGISTLAAALIPQHALRRSGTTSTTGTTGTAPPTIAGTAPPAVPPTAVIVVGGRRLPVIPVHVGQRFTILASSRQPAELSIPAFGLVSFATPIAPARFELLTETRGTFGILFDPPVKVGKCLEQVAALIQVLKRGEKPKMVRSPKCAARAGSGRS